MAQIEGLWTIEIEPISGWSKGGIVVFQAGRILGGGDHYYCVGHYDERGTKVSGTARFFHFHGAAFNAFDDTSPDFRIAFSGSRHEENLAGEIHRADRPETKLPFRLIWRAEL
jgi:hypothetical protein